MKLTVIIDNLCTVPSLLAEWGYAVHIECSAGNLLFDTGRQGHILIHNMQHLGVIPSKIQHIVLSHGHYDHVGGLSDIIRYAPHARIWGACSIGTERRRDADAGRINGGCMLFSIDGFNFVNQEANIMPGVTAFIVPQSQRDTKYQKNKNLWEVCDGKIIPDTFADDLSLLVEGKNGITLVVGCAHSGLPNILNYVRSHFGITAIDTIVGGTHLSAFNSDELSQCMERLKKFTVKRWRPNHCTGFIATAELSKICADVDMAGAGTVLEL